MKRAGTVVLGLGMATLTAQDGVVPMTVADVDGVVLSGVIFDAGPVNSPVLLQVGQHGPKSQASAAAGATRTARPCSTTCSSASAARTSARRPSASRSTRDDVILDHIWAWRGDHGAGVGWTVNTADTGVVVNGDNVLATGLFAEHYQKHNVIWNGENGRTILFQNELPYDPPNQAAWQHDGVLGWAAYKVADSVKTHEGWGLGSYAFFNVDPTIHTSRAFEVPGDARRQAARHPHPVDHGSRSDRPCRERLRAGDGREHDARQRRLVPVAQGNWGPPSGAPVPSAPWSRPNR